MNFRSIYQHGFARVAACTARIAIADPPANAEAILRQARACADEHREQHPHGPERSATSAVRLSPPPSKPRAVPARTARAAGTVRRPGAGIE